MRLSNDSHRCGKDCGSRCAVCEADLVKLKEHFKSYLITSENEDEMLELIKEKVQKAGHLLNSKLLKIIFSF